MMRAILAALAGLALMGCAATKPLPARTYDADGPVTGLSGWNELVITTRDWTVWDDFLTQQAGWELRAAQETSPALNGFWGMPTTAQGKERVYANIGSESGFIRLVQLDGIEQDVIRADDRPWDTGGYFDFNVRVTGLRELRKTMVAQGWQGDSEPIQYTFGPFEVIEWIARGPDGVRIAFIERLKPTLEGWPDLKIVSRTFNSTQTVRDIGKARDFFQGVLGMKVYLEHVGASGAPGPNVLGLPHEAATEVDRIVYILHHDGLNEGSIELLAFDGASGMDFSGKAVPYNIGLSALRFPVADLTQTMAAIASRGGVFEGEPVRLHLKPYGDVEMVAMTAPDGGRIEIYEVLEP